jgi:inorganic pyrophosphatase
LEINELTPSSTTFWGFLDCLVATSKVIIDRPKNSTHPHYPEIIYPLDYGYLEDTVAVDGGGVDIWKGTSGTCDLTSVVLTVDLYKRDAEIKILIGCTEEDIQTILDFHNSESMQALLVRRSIT